MISVLIGTDVGLASMTSTTGGGDAGASFFPHEVQSNAMTGKITMGIVKNIEPLKVSVFLGMLAEFRRIGEKGAKPSAHPAFSDISQQVACTCVKPIRARARHRFGAKHRD
jgi:hypothetical protein